MMKKLLTAVAISAVALSAMAQTKELKLVHKETMLESLLGSTLEL